MSSRMDCFGMTDTSKKAGDCDDQFLIADLNKSLRVHQTSLSLDDETRLFGSSQGKLLLVADGAGSTGAAERASTLAVDSITTYLLNTMPWFYRLEERQEDDFRDDLVAVLQHCQTTLQREGSVIHDHEGMGTSLTMVYVIWPRMFAVHVGDTRCYLLRNSKMLQLTEDHTVAEKLVEKGQLPRDKAAAHVSSNMLWNVIGGESGELRPQVVATELQLDDKLLLATDGLHKHLSEQRLGELLNSPDSAETLCRRLIQEAIGRGSTDATTGIVVHFESGLMTGSDATKEQAGVETPGIDVVSVPDAGHSLQSSRLMC